MKNATKLPGIHTMMGMFIVKTVWTGGINGIHKAGFLTLVILVSMVHMLVAVVLITCVFPVKWGMSNVERKNIKNQGLHRTNHEAVG